MDKNKRNNKAEKSIIIIKDITNKVLRNTAKTCVAVKFYENLNGRLNLEIYTNLITDEPEQNLIYELIRRKKITDLFDFIDFSKIHLF